jgi:molybdate transport system substrate-binding protein
LLFCLSIVSSAEEITVAAAADLQSAMADIAARYQKETGNVVKVSYGSSGNFFQQLQNGAPFDAFFSANIDYPKKLEAAGLTESGGFYQYATGRIVLWVRSDSTLDIKPGLSSLLNPTVKKVAIANPEHAPYGQAAVAALKKENLYDQLSSKFVLGENISQTATFAATGAADAGIIALSLAMSSNMKDKGRYTEVPADDYPPIEQACVVMKTAKAKAAALAFVTYIKTPAIGDLLRSYGFAVK